MDKEVLSAEGERVVPAETTQANATPFILQFLEVREGATAVTTCGTWDDIDAGDVS